MPRAVRWESFFVILGSENHLVKQKTTHNEVPKSWKT